MKRLVAPCARSVRLSKAPLLVSVHLSAEASTTRAPRPKGTGTELAGEGSGARRRSAGSVPVPVPGAPASAVPAPTLPAGTCTLQKAEQPRHLLTPSRRASFEVAVFGAESFLDRALIASLASASGRAHPEQVSVAAAKSPPAIHLAAVGNPTRLRTTVIDAQVARLRHADASLDGARASASVSDAQAAVHKPRFLAAVAHPSTRHRRPPPCALQNRETRVPLAAPPRERIVCLLRGRRIARPPSSPPAEPVAARASRAARRVSLSSLVVLRAHSASPGAVPARLVRAHANAAVDAATAVTDSLEAASGSDAELLLGVAARVVTAQSANHTRALAAGDGARVAAAVGDAKVGGAARALPAALVLASAPAPVGDALPSGARSDGAAGHGAPTAPPWEEHRPPRSATRVHPSSEHFGETRARVAAGRSGLEGGRPRRTRPEFVSGEAAS